MTVEEALAFAETVLSYERLNKVQEIVFRQSWERQSYMEIAKKSGYEAGYIKDAGSKLWRLLSNKLGKKVTKNNFESVLKRYAQQTQVLAAVPAKSLSDIKVNSHNSQTGELIGILEFGNATTATRPLQDWGEAIDISVFYGRTAELRELEQWTVQEFCRLVLVLGMGGVGKTALCAKLAERIHVYFEHVIWRSLRNAPPIQEILTTLIKFLSNEQEANLPESVDGKILRLIEYLRSSRCLLILDNVESILESGNYTGHYREGYEGYGQLLRCIGETRHQSCLLLTSREKPRGLASKESKVLPIRGMQLTGLHEEDIKKLFETKGFCSGSKDEWRLLNNYYSGNPLALQMAVAAIQNVFDNNLTNFIAYSKERALVFDDIRTLLDQQFNRLSLLEEEVMYWLAINREKVTLAELNQDVLLPESKQKLIDTLGALKQRSLVEVESTTFTQQPIVMDYVTKKIVAKVYDEIVSEDLQLLISHALLKDQAKDNIKASQICVILEPLVASLYTNFRTKRALEYKFKRIILKVREEFNALPGYGCGNIINLLHQLKIDLADYNSWLCYKNRGGGW